jgi:hypothetical protein
MGEATVLAVLADPHCKEFARDGERSSRLTAHVGRHGPSAAVVRVVQALVVVMVLLVLVLVLLVMLVVVGRGGQHDVIVLSSSSIFARSHLSLVGHAMLLLVVMSFHLLLLSCGLFKF